MNIEIVDILGDFDAGMIKPSADFCGLAAMSFFSSLRIDRPIGIISLPCNDVPIFGLASRANKDGGFTVRPEMEKDSTRR